MATQDPFLVVKKEVEGSLDNATALFDSWKRIYNTVSSPSNEELMWTADELSSSLEAINQDLDDLQESIAAVQAHPEAFNLSGSEVQSRNNFITRTRNTVREMEDTIRNPPRKASPRNNQGSSSRHLPGEYDASPFADENQRYIDNASGQQAMMMQDQDTQLDSISGTLHNLKDIAGTMHQEVEDHVVLLDELDQHVDMSSNRLGRAMNRVKHILRKEEGK
ncbi:hypothetical protein K450DRAFT_236556 [Umbelopsis ramanniana AG]|uniref:t-SNARE coiled-coil homology domain-containing protein n=1 Tax=Umbelopsis ramanniana AG TaxID=1314678 RepID=A0AAD5HFF6_UMBRA|nr:uncharacterized protein K450DRAFT_236556 [Umbelopsis ramanniana AG]KAI8580636.1 hypothetical protein K450DRAFT_236556 [Umbelopsis ramanniana AG]